MQGMAGSKLPLQPTHGTWRQRVSADCLSSQLTRDVRRLEQKHYYRKEKGGFLPTAKVGGIRRLICDEQNLTTTVTTAAAKKETASDGQTTHHQAGLGEVYQHPNPRLYEIRA